MGNGWGEIDLYEPGGKAGVQDFGMDDLLGGEVRISPFSGAQRVVLRAHPGLETVAVDLIRDIERCKAVACSFSWSDGRGDDRRRHPVEVKVFFGLPPGDGSVFAGALETSAVFMVRDGKMRMEEPQEALDVDFDALELSLPESAYAVDSQAVIALSRLVWHETRERSKLLIRKTLRSFESGELRERYDAWYEDEVRKMFHKAVAKFSDLPVETLHRFIDELAVKQVLEE